ncbi:unnamed protein product [Trichogramma brassicae]|uniref:Reverse transcriptase domain-containing protein n=1 Tax=Trichogramma brassicae TaxID=86971 RepID=A0A6H5IZE2_9HYME|nr:unnamed protein product [Trichogramma brassicae]
MDNKWCNAQYGFRQGRSSEDLLCRFRNMVDHSSAKLVAGVLVDFKGAFDYLSWHSILDRLDLVGHSNEEMGLWSSYFADRSVFLMNRRSDQVARRSLERGCPQGSIGGPTVWNLALDELLWQLEQVGIPVVAYADDTTCLAEGESRDQFEASVERAFGLIYDWCDKYGSRLLRGHTLLASPPELDIFFRTRCLVPSCECGSRFCCRRWQVPSLLCRLHLVSVVLASGATL